MTELYAQKVIDKMFSGEIPFDEETYSEALDVLTKDIFDDLT